jgi:hypothetical protein
MHSQAVSTAIAVAWRTLDEDDLQNDGNPELRGCLGLGRIGGGSQPDNTSARKRANQQRPATRTTQRTTSASARSVQVSTPRSHMQLQWPPRRDGRHLLRTRGQRTGPPSQRSVSSGWWNASPEEINEPCWLQPASWTARASGASTRSWFMARSTTWPPAPRHGARPEVTVRSGARSNGAVNL